MIVASIDKSTNIFVTVSYHIDGFAISPSLWLVCVCRHICWINDIYIYIIKIYERFLSSCKQMLAYYPQPLR